MFSKLLAVFAFLAASNAAVLERTDDTCDVTLKYVELGTTAVTQTATVTLGQCTQLNGVFVAYDVIRLLNPTETDDCKKSTGQQLFFYATGDCTGTSGSYTSGAVSMKTA
ncbi:hypothetical protein FB45DRAFT_936569 [Roridomyces roridus]|uniref:Uncharacterized protein n=1 Tax=Roridomyces roridus TaxID=1738132 RepID=A0AAD7BAH9_9AGAR|nr:hypothetical protein FB45DRAFT_936569 [Roridomyces roridus]